MVTFEPPEEPCPDSSQARKFGSHWEWFEGKLMMPVYTPRGELLGFDARSVERKDPLRWVLKSAAWNPAWIGMPLAMDRIWEGRPVWIVEGYFDFFALEHAVGKDAILGTGPARLNYRHVEFLRRWKPPMVNLCFDQDEAGYKGRDKALEDLTRLRVTCRSIPYGNTGDDPGLIWTRGGASAVTEAFDRFI